MIRAVGVHDERKVLGVASDDKVRPQVNLGHGPTFRPVRAKSGEFAHRGHTRRRVSDHASEPKGFFVAIAVVGFGRSRQRHHHLFAHVGGANKGFSNIGRDVPGQRVLRSRLGLGDRFTACRRAFH